MHEKYVLRKDYDCPDGTLPAGTEIIFFRGRFYVSNFPVSTNYNSLFKKIISDENLVIKKQITKNSFGE